jgi:hypothetical protein
MGEWVQVDVNEINKEVKKDLQGVEVRVSFSPYDVPRRYRSYRDPNSDFFVIEFQYLLEEETHTEKPAEQMPVELEVGDNSKRIYKIKINMEKLGVEAVQLKIEPLARNVLWAIKQFSTTVPLKFRERYKMPESLIYNRRDKVFSGIGGESDFTDNAPKAHI